MAYFAIAAGHGGGDPGAVGADKRYEKDDNLKVALAVGDELKKRGHSVAQYRTYDTPCPAADCRKWIAQIGADFAICFHRNAFNGTATGVEVWSFGDALSVTIASEMSEKISAQTGLYNRGRKGNGAAWISDKVPCVEPELGFIDNPSDNRKFDDSFGKIVSAVCDVLENHFGKPVIDIEPEEDEKPAPPEEKPVIVKPDPEDKPDTVPDGDKTDIAPEISFLRRLLAAIKSIIAALREYFGEGKDD